MDEEVYGDDHQFVLAVEGRIDVVPVSDIQSSTDFTLHQGNMAAVSTESALKSTEESENVLNKPAPSSARAVKKSLSTPNNSKDLYSLPRKGAFSKEREEINKRAFELWLSKKLEEDKQRQSQASTPTESIEEKKRMNEKAFEAWLEKKKSIQAMNAAAKLEAERSKSTCRTAKSSCGFEEWVRKKNEEKAKKLEFEALKRKELEESAARVDPVVSKKAYSR